MNKKLLTLFVLLTVVYFAYARYSRPKLVYICEGNSMKLSCKYNQVIKVLYASYGRKNSTICTDEDSVVDMNLDCRTDNATNIVRQNCSFKPSCTLEANSNVFGDPCPGTSKYSVLKYKCIYTSRPTRHRSHYRRRHSKSCTHKKRNDTEIETTTEVNIE